MDEALPVLVTSTAAHTAPTSHWLLSNPPPVAVDHWYRLCLGISSSQAGPQQSLLCLQALQAISRPCRCLACKYLCCLASLQALQDEFKGMQAVQPRKDKEEVDTGLELVNKRLPKQQRDKALKEVRQCAAVLGGLP